MACCWSGEGSWAGSGGSVEDILEHVELSTKIGVLDRSD